MRKKLFAISWILIALIFITQMVETIHRNSVSILMAQGAFHNKGILGSAYADYQVLSEKDCHANWMAGRAADLLGKEDEKITAWTNYLECSNSSVNYLKLVLPMDAEFAEKAVNLYPDNITALYWLASSKEKLNPLESIKSYNRITQLDSSQGLAWCRLGFLYESNQYLAQAVTSYLMCCSSGDPGENGCYGAGRVTEHLGKPIKAIEYYRLSRWQGALDRANVLEKQLQP